MIIRAHRITLAALSLCLFASFASAATLSGTVKNGTTGKPSVGDDVVLLKLQTNMEEAARTKSDKTGHFKFTTDGPGPFLIRVTHDQVNYHKPAPPGTTSVDLEVYDASAAAADINGTVYDMAMQARDGYIEVQEVYAVDNKSNPPRTYNPDRSMKIVLPAGAQIEDSLVSGPGGMPVKSAPVPSGTPGEYGYAYPVRPGQTTFSVMYRLPYNGKTSFDPKPQYQFQHFAVEIPKAMALSPASGLLKTMPEKDGVTAVLASNVKPGDNLKFAVSGLGDFPRDTQAGGADAASSGDSAGTADNSQRPGGGIGAPEGTPDPLQKAKWLGVSATYWVLAGLGIILVGGAVYVVNRPTIPTAATPASPNGSSAHRTSAAASMAQSSLTDVLKDELFQLEVEQHQGRISRAEYERVKAALDVVIARAVQRHSKPAGA
jgi:hypothetical protein